MSHEKVKSVKIDEKEKKVFLNSACSNLRPLDYHTWECTSLSEILKEKGKEAVEIEILKTFEEGTFQGKTGKYAKAMKVLQYALKEEHAPFYWRNNKHKYGSEEDKKFREGRESQEFKDLLKRALNTKLPKKRFILSKNYDGEHYQGEVYLKKCIHSAYWTKNKAEAKKYHFKEELEDIKSCYPGSESWTIEEVED